MGPLSRGFRPGCSPAAAPGRPLTLALLSSVPCGIPGWSLQAGDPHRVRAAHAHARAQHGASPRGRAVLCAAGLQGRADDQRGNADHPCRPGVSRVHAGACHVAPPCIQVAPVWQAHSSSFPRPRQTHETHGSWPRAGSGTARNPPLLNTYACMCSARALVAAWRRWCVGQVPQHARHPLGGADGGVEAGGAGGARQGEPSRLVRRCVHSRALRDACPLVETSAS